MTEYAMLIAFIAVVLLVVFTVVIQPNVESIEFHLTEGIIITKPGIENKPQSLEPTYATPLDKPPKRNKSRLKELLATLYAWRRIIILGVLLVFIILVGSLIISN